MFVDCPVLKAGIVAEIGRFACYIVCILGMMLCPRFYLTNNCCIIWRCDCRSSLADVWVSWWNSPRQQQRNKFYVGIVSWRNSAKWSNAKRRLSLATTLSFTTTLKPTRSQRNSYNPTPKPCHPHWLNQPWPTLHPPLPFS